MKLISHRGNTNGPNKDLENTWDYIYSTLQLGYDVEIDIWSVLGKLYLGHDEPQHHIDPSFIKSNKIWCHAKNFDALDFMLNSGIRCFWHQDDDYTITSCGKIWTYPQKNVSTNSILVCTTLNSHMASLDFNCFGICSDYVGFR